VSSTVCVTRGDAILLSRAQSLSLEAIKLSIQAPRIIGITEAHALSPLSGLHLLHHLPFPRTASVVGLADSPLPQKLSDENRRDASKFGESLRRRGSLDC